MLNEIIIPKSGNNSVLQLIQKINLDYLPEGFVRIKVAYSGINFADILMRLGLYPDAPKFPFVPGYEVSGEVIEIGSGVKEISVGDKIMAGTKFSGYSSELILPANQVLPIGPFSLEEAAALPVSFLTAYLVFFEEARVREGDKILIDCATGSLGQLSMQMLSKMSLDIIGLTSSHGKKNIIEKFGAKAMTHDEFENSNEKDFHIILNSQGARSIKTHYNRLAPTGKIVCIGASSLFQDGKRSWFKLIKEFLQFPKFNVIELMNDNRGVMGLNVLKLFETPEYLMDLLKKAEGFELKPTIDKIFPASEASQAHSYLELRKAKGKVLLKWG